MPKRFRDRLQHCAFLHSGVRISFSDEAAGTRDDFEYADGVREYVRHLNAGRTPLHDAIVIRGEADGVRYEVGLQWCVEEIELSAACANGEANLEGGSHQSGTRTSASRAVVEFIREYSGASGDVKREDARGGLTAVVSVWLANPQYEGATRWRLNSPEAERVVAAAVGSGLRDYFTANRAVAEAVVRRTLAERDAREADRAARKQK